MRSIKTLLGSSLLALSLLSPPGIRPRKKRRLSTLATSLGESGSLITEILRLIVEEGYGYPTDTLPGSTVSLEAALGQERYPGDR